MGYLNYEWTSESCCIHLHITAVLHPILKSTGNEGGLAVVWHYMVRSGTCLHTDILEWVQAGTATYEVTSEHFALETAWARWELNMELFLLTKNNI